MQRSRDRGEQRGLSLNEMQLEIARASAMGQVALGPEAICRSQDCFVSR